MRRTNVILWTIQGLLALAFLIMSGATSAMLTLAPLGSSPKTVLR